MESKQPPRITLEEVKAKQARIENIDGQEDYLQEVLRSSPSQEIWTYGFEEIMRIRPRACEIRGDRYLEQANKEMQIDIVLARTGDERGNHYGDAQLLYSKSRNQYSEGISIDTRYPTPEPLKQKLIRKYDAAIREQVDLDEKLGRALGLN